MTRWASERGTSGSTVRSSEQFTTVSSIRRSVAHEDGDGQEAGPEHADEGGRARPGAAARRLRPPAARTTSVIAVRRRSIGLMSRGPSRVEAYVSGETRSDESSGNAGGT